jgi:hypothetical protein
MIFASNLRTGLAVAALITVLAGCGGLDVRSTTPVANATNVPIDAEVTATFSAPVRASDVTESTFKLLEGGNPIPGDVTVNGAVATFVPETVFNAHTTYTAVLSAGIKDEGDHTLGGEHRWSFTTGDVGPPGAISGHVTYDRVPALEGGPNADVFLDYSASEVRPARRVRVEAVGRNGAVAGYTHTNDQGDFVIPNVPGVPVTVRAVSSSAANANVRDGIGAEFCTGASWELEVNDNTQGYAVYALEDPTRRTPPASDVNLHAATVFESGSGYTRRAGAPFAMLDTLVSSIERVCQAAPSTNFPSCELHWSVNNVATGGSLEAGQIITSHYDADDLDRDGRRGDLYILGKEDVDTDEYDDHVIAHEFGHYLEDRLYRTDSLGGPHSKEDLLDPRLAFGEGFGNGFSAIALNDPLYVDTANVAQARGFTITIADAPVDNDRGVYSEQSVGHLIWRLYDNRDGVANSGNYDRIHTVLLQDHRVTEAFTTAQSFAAYYNARYGNSDGLQSLWESTLDGDYDSLCDGLCTGTAGTDVADPWDLNNDLGIQYDSANRRYDGSLKDAEFWRLYRTLTGTGFASPGTAHEQKAYDGSSQSNRFGMRRWYRYPGVGQAKTIKVTTPNVAGGCGTNALDALLVHRGVLLQISNSATGCPSVAVPGEAGKTYLIDLFGSTSTPEVNGWGMEVTP